MALPTQPYKGARDFYPDDKRLQKYMFAKMRQVVESFGYQEYDAPILESLDVYLAKTGEEIINEQIYSFTDRGERKVAMRPEMTPSVSRMVAAKRQELAYPLRWYSIPELWRYERPQAGRLRQHWQLNVDLFGVAGIEGDHEIIVIADNLFKVFNPPEGSYVIRISSRKLVDNFFKTYMGLDDDQFHQTIKLIDRWHKIGRDDFHAQAKDVLNDQQYAELIKLLESKDLDSLPEEAKKHDSVEKLRKLVDLLSASGVKAAEFDFSVIRGMDYYDDIVFEVFDTNPENIRSMAGGGRYDGLVGLFGVEPVPTVGFAIGDVTLQRFLELHNLVPKLEPETDAVVILVGDVYSDAQPVVAELRSKGLNLAVDSTGRKLDVQLKHAAKSGAQFAILVGEAELSSGKLKLRNLLKGEEQELSPEETVQSVKSGHGA